MDLGARPAKVFFLITMPIILPAICAGLAARLHAVLGRSRDHELRHRARVRARCPIVIFSKVRLGVSPDINALATILVLLVAIVHGGIRNLYAAPAEAARPGRPARHRGQRVMPASKLPGVGTTIFTVMSRLAAETGAINLGQGFPDFDPPERLRELVAHHLGAGHNQYAPMAGLPALCEAIAGVGAAPARLAHRSGRRDHGHGRRDRGDLRGDPCHRARRRGSDPARSELRLLRSGRGACRRARRARAACGRGLRHRLGAPRGGHRAAHAAAGRQHAAEPGRGGADGWRLGPHRRPARGHGRLCAVRRGLRGARLRRPPARGRARQRAAARARLRGVLLRKDLQRDGLEGRLLRCGAAAHGRIPQGAPVPDLRRLDARAARDRGLHARSTGVRRRAGRLSTRRAATGSRRLLEGSRFVLRPVHGTYFQLADYSAISDLPDAASARS